MSRWSCRCRRRKSCHWKSHRRSIYRFLVRSQPAPFMDTLDCADPSLGKEMETSAAQSGSKYRYFECIEIPSNK